ncbi:MAG TPA: glycosyltransferase family 8 protein [Vagococcus sp.]|nr:glycosyltransferase family 8 protein [Vagococcus sp.]HCT95834.1 glycosyltransferase family 8 protein [Vagococcus sp.]
MLKPMHLLVTLDEGYVYPLKVMLLSLFENNPDEEIKVWLVHAGISVSSLTSISRLVNQLGGTFEPCLIDDTFFDSAPVVERYPKEMYFRLLAGQILPEELERVLYIDPDTLIINPLTNLWEMDLQGYMFGAAVHKGITNLTTGINNIRLGTKHGYYNSGIMLIDLQQARQKIHLADIEYVIQQSGHYLMLPDQDILNFLYGEDILEIPEEKWNYDTRKFKAYYARSLTKIDLHWVIENTHILHFCGRPKPWEKESDGRFVALYHHYEQRLHRYNNKIDRGENNG